MSSGSRCTTNDVCDQGKEKEVLWLRLFGWSFAETPAAIGDYWHIDTGGKDATPDERAHAAHASATIHHQLCRRAVGDPWR